MTGGGLGCGSGIQLILGSLRNGVFELGFAGEFRVWGFRFVVMGVPNPSRQIQPTSPPLRLVYFYGRASNIKLNGVWVALRKWLKPPAETTSRSRCSPACAPKAKPTSWDSEAGVQSSVDAP
jgi:hypothetical protein